MNPASSTTMPLPKGGRHQRSAALRALPPSAAVMARLLAPDVHATPAPLRTPARIFEAAWQAKPVAPPAADMPDATDRILPAQADILAVVAHELRNGLMPIRLAAAQLRGARKDELSLMRLRVSIERQLDHMARLVGDLLDISRPSSNVSCKTRMRSPSTARAWASACRSCASGCRRTAATWSRAVPAADAAASSSSPSPWRAARHPRAGPSRPSAVFDAMRNIETASLVA